LTVALRCEIGAVLSLFRIDAIAGARNDSGMTVWVHFHSCDTSFLNNVSCGPKGFSRTKSRLVLTLMIETCFASISMYTILELKRLLRDCRVCHNHIIIDRGDLLYTLTEHTAPQGPRWETKLWSKKVADLLPLRVGN
jgi:hypothetical protein